MQLNVGASQKTINKFANFLRFETGRKSAPSHYANYLSDKSKILDDTYKEKILEFDTESKKTKEKRSIFYADAELLLETFVTKQNIIGNYAVNIMADGVQGLFKICLKKVLDLS